MSKLLAFLVCFSFTAAAVKGQQEDQPFFIDPHVRLVDHFEGWGTSLAWWADVLGGMPDDVIAEVTDAFFSPEKLNLNIVRYAIGGTTPNTTVCGEYRPGAATESYQDGLDEPFDWTRDARQRKILQLAKSLGANTFEAFSNSPPQWMTITGCSKGNSLGGLLHANFASDQAANFANYITEVLKHFSTDFGITFESYVPFNEPYGLLGAGGWTGQYSSQEGCNMAQSVMVEVIKAMHEAFEANGVQTKISAADETQVDTAVYTQNSFRNANISGLIEKVNVHGYWDSAIARRDHLYLRSLQDGHRLWMDEMGWGETPIGNMGQGLEIATRIVTDLRNMLPSAWVYWQVMEDVGQWGLLHVPYNEPSVESITYNNGYYSMTQFSRYIKEGSSIIHISDRNAIAAYNPATSELVIVFVNSEEQASRTSQVDLSLIDIKVPTLMKVIRTSASELNADISTSEDIALSGSLLKTSLPAQSITTVSIGPVVLNDTGNLIKNGDFEQGFVGWAVKGTGTGLDTQDPWQGKNTGFVGNGTLSQSLVHTGASDATLFVSCWCASSKGATISLKISGQIVATTEVDSIMYKSYGISAPVKSKQIVTFTFEALDGVSHIDRVSARLA